MMVVKQETRFARQKQTGEIFTPPKLVNDMLNKIPTIVWEENKTFCDIACGNGEFLIWILIKKIERGHNPLSALKTIYGVDLMRDNVNECRARLLKIISLWETIQPEHIETVVKNIVCANSLNYKFNFRKPKRKVVANFTALTKTGLQDVSIPINSNYEYNMENPAINTRNAKTILSNHNRPTKSGRIRNPKPRNEIKRNRPTAKSRKSESRNLKLFDI